MVFFQKLAPRYPGFSTALYSTPSKLGTVTGRVLFGLLAGSLSDRGLFVLSAVLSVLGAFTFATVTRSYRSQAG